MNCIYLSYSTEQPALKGVLMNHVTRNASSSIHLARRCVALAGLTLS